MRRALLAAAAVLALASPVLAAENPVLDPEGDADVAEALAEATSVQGVCYGYELTVRDLSTGRYDGQYASSSLGPGVPASLSAGGCPQGTVVLTASIVYTSELSESEDSASWRLDSTLPALTVRDLERLGLSAEDLLDDGRSETTLLNAVLALPQLAAETGAVPPLLLEPNTEPLPADARPTGTPGSDWLRENGTLLALCSVLVAVGAVVLLLSFRTARRGVGGLGTILDL